MKKNKIKICVVGWHFFSDFYNKLDQSKYETYIVAHRYNKILDAIKLEYSVIENIGLEFHAYDYYIKNIWDKKSNVIFMHDDIEIEDIKCLYKIFKRCEKENIYQCYIFGEKGKGSHGRCIYMSKKFIEMIIKDYDGIWFDRENKECVDSKSSIKNKWDKKRYNYGTYKFEKYSKKIGKKYNVNTCISINNSGLILYYRAKNILR